LLLIVDVVMGKRLSKRNNLCDPLVKRLVVYFMCFRNLYLLLHFMIMIRIALFAIAAMFLQK